MKRNCLSSRVLSLFVLLSLVAFVRSALAAPYAYVANAVDGSVSIVDLAANTVVASVPTGPADAVAVAPGGAALYVLNVSQQTLTRVDTAARAITSVVALPGPLVVNPSSTTGSGVGTTTGSATTGGATVGLAVNGSGTCAYVSDTTAGVIHVFDLTANAALPDIGVADNPTALAIDPGSSHLYVARDGGVAVIDLVSPSATPSSTVLGFTVSAVAVSRDGSAVYASSADASTLAVLDPSGVAAPSVFATNAAGPNVTGLSVSPDGRALEIGRAGGTISVVDVSSYSLSATIALALGSSAIGNFVSDLAPVANATTATVPPVGGAAITLSGTDPDHDPLTFRVMSGPSNGSLSGIAPLLTYTPNAGYAGPDSFMFVANDGAIDSAPAAVSITVPAKGSGSAVVTVSALTPQYSDLETIRAAFTPAVPGGPAPASVTFKIGTQVMGQATPVFTGSVYQYSWRGQLVEPSPYGTAPIRQMKPDFHTVSAVFADPYVTSNNAYKAITITAEDARVAYTGPTAVSLQGSATGTVMLSVTVKDITAVPGDPAWDPYPGDIRNARVSFIDRATNTILGTVSPTLAGTGTDPTVGTATLAWPVNLGTAPSKTYDIGFIVGYYYRRNSTADDARITVVK